MINVYIATLFPEMCETVLNESIVGRARKNQLVNLNCLNIRNYAENKHKHVDDYPYGGSKGMVMQCEPIYKCYLDVCEKIKAKPYVVYMSPQGKNFTQQKAAELSNIENIFILCGHYEGVDQRILDEIVDEEISVGDYVLTGGELPALVVTDAIVRLCDGVLSDEQCYKNESHFNGLLEYPQYTRPDNWNGKKVPEILMSGHHANIEKWRLEKSIEVTKNKRPDLFKKYNNKANDNRL